MIQLPELFLEKLAKAPSLSESVRHTFELFEPWLEQSGMPFFPGFTDHSPRHINQVLATAASLIADKSHELLTAEDVAVLCMSILLHDCGMHLTQDMFRDLVIDHSPPQISDLGDVPWARLWSDFISEANRFGQDKLLAVFGDTQPLDVKTLNLDNLSERDCLLIGEFVRRHHPRLAHEIANKGIARSSGEPLRLTGMDSEFRDIAGLIARSHGLSIRATFDYITDRYGLLAEYKGIKIPYLMAVLRIADYVQVKSERAIKTLLSVKELRSPISRQEWKAHFSVHDVSTKHADPEALYVHAKPSDVKLYLKLAGLFADIQRELDESWGALGEVYGRLDPLADLGLSIRRIRSNLDNRDAFSKSVVYVPIKAGFDTSGPDLLKLLVGPLYDYEYDVAVRELVQNSVDACRELIDLRSRAGESEPQKDVGVMVELTQGDDRTGWLTVTDTGIGMTLETIVKYFLVAGASFRNSDLWKKQHVDDAGVIKITRGGRFGVGALAAFLLGEEIQVRTRHADGSETDGIEFKARIDEPVVELRRCAAPAGTSIKVWISDTNIMSQIQPRYGRALSGDFAIMGWHAADWFLQSRPSVTYKWDGFCFSEGVVPEFRHMRAKESYQPAQQEFVPHDLEDVGTWHVLADPDPYRAILWRFHDDNSWVDERIGYAPIATDRAVVNGIHVQSYEKRDRFVSLPRQEDAFSVSYTIDRPSLSIYDPLGICPINLQRSAIAFERMGLDERLSEAILVDYFERLRDTFRIKTLAELDRLCKRARERRAVTYPGQVPPFWLTKLGLILGAQSALRSQKINILFHISGDISTNEFNVRDILEPREALTVRSTQYPPGIQSNLEWFRGAITFSSERFGYSRQAGFLGAKRDAIAAMVNSSTWANVNGKGRVRRDILDSIRSQKVGKNKVFLHVGNKDVFECLRNKIERICEKLGEQDEVYGWFLSDHNSTVSEETVMMQAWLKVFDGMVVE